MRGYLLALTAQFGVLLMGLATWAVLDYAPSIPVPVPLVHEKAAADPAATVVVTHAPSMVRGASGPTVRPAAQVPVGWRLG